MRDRFKFRVWNVKEKIMEYGAELAYDNGHGGGDCLWAGSFGHVIESSINTDDYILMQSANIKDKNNKLVYEGDLLKDNYGLVREIVYGISCGYCCFQVIGLKTEGRGSEDFIYFINEFEIIGNRYENPELLNLIK